MPWRAFTAEPYKHHGVTPVDVFIRQALTIIGGMLLSRGYVTESQWDLIAGCIIILASVGHAIYTRNRLRNELLQVNIKLREKLDECRETNEHLIRCKTDLGQAVARLIGREEVINEQLSLARPDAQNGGTGKNGERQNPSSDMATESR